MLSIANAVRAGEARAECTFRFGASGVPVTARDESGAPVSVARGMCVTAVRLVGPATAARAVLYLARSQSPDGPLSASSPTTRVVGADIARGAVVGRTEGTLSDATYVTAVVFGGAGGEIVRASLTIVPADDAAYSTAALRLSSGSARATEFVEFAHPATTDGASLRVIATARPTSVGAYYLPMSPATKTHELRVRFGSYGATVAVEGDLLVSAPGVLCSVEPSDGGFVVYITQPSTAAETADVAVTLTAPSLTRSAGGVQWRAEAGAPLVVYLLAPLRLAGGGTYRAGTTDPQLVEFTANDALPALVGVVPGSPSRIVSVTSHTAGTRSVAVPGAIGIERPADEWSAAVSVVYAGISPLTVVSSTPFDSLVSGGDASSRTQSLSARSERTGAAIPIGIVESGAQATLYHRTNGVVLAAEADRAVVCDRTQLVPLATLRLASDGAYDALTTDGRVAFLHGELPPWALWPTPGTVASLGDVLVGGLDPAPPPVNDAARYIAVTPRARAEACSLVDGAVVAPSDAYCVRVAQRFRLTPPVPSYAVLCAPSIPALLEGRPVLRGALRPVWPPAPGTPIPAARTAIRLWSGAGPFDELPTAILADSQWRVVTARLVDAVDGTVRSGTMTGTPVVSVSGLAGCSVRNERIVGSALQFELHATTAGTARVAVTGLTFTPADARYATPPAVTVEAADVVVLASAPPTPLFSAVVGSASAALRFGVLDSTSDATVELTLPTPLRFAPSAQYDPRGPLADALGVSVHVSVTVTFGTFARTFRSEASSPLGQRVVRVTETTIVVPWAPPASVASTTASASFVIVAPVCVVDAAAQCALAAPYASLTVSVPCAPPPSHFECAPHARGISLVVRASPDTAALVPSEPPVGTVATDVPGVYSLSGAAPTDVTLPPCSFAGGGYLLAPRVVPVYAAGATRASASILACAPVPSISFAFFDGARQLYPCSFGGGGAVTTTVVCGATTTYPSAANDGTVLTVAALVTPQPLGSAGVRVSFPSTLVLSETRCAPGTMPGPSARRSSARECYVPVFERNTALAFECSALDLSAPEGAECGTATVVASRALGAGDVPIGSATVRLTEPGASEPIALLLDTGVLVRGKGRKPSSTVLFVATGLTAIPQAAGLATGPAAGPTGPLAWTLLRSAPFAPTYARVPVAAQCTAHYTASAAQYPAAATGLEFVVYAADGSRLGLASVGAVSTAQGAGVGVASSVIAVSSGVSRCVVTFTSETALLGLTVLVRVTGATRSVPVPILPGVSLEGPFAATTDTTTSALWQAVGNQTRYYRAVDHFRVPITLTSLAANPTYTGHAVVSASIDTGCVKLVCSTPATTGVSAPYSWEPTGTARVHYSLACLKPAFATALVGQQMLACSLPTVVSCTLYTAPARVTVIAGVLSVSGTTAVSDVQLATSLGAVAATVVYGATEKYSHVCRIDCGAGATRVVTTVANGTSYVLTIVADVADASVTAGTRVLPIDLATTRSVHCGRVSSQVVLYATSPVTELTVTDDAGTGVRYDREIASVRAFTLESSSSLRAGAYTVGTAYGTESALSVSVVDACPSTVVLSVGFAVERVTCTIPCPVNGTRYVVVHSGSAEVRTTLVADGSVATAGTLGSPIDLSAASTAKCTSNAGFVVMHANVPASQSGMVVYSGTTPIEVDTAYTTVERAGTVTASTSPTYVVTAATLSAAGRGFASGVAVAAIPPFSLGMLKVTLSSGMVDATSAFVDVPQPHVYAVPEPSVVCARGLSSDGRALSHLATRGTGGLALMLTPLARLVDASKVTLSVSGSLVSATAIDAGGDGAGAVAVRYTGGAASMTVTLGAGAIAVAGVAYQTPITHGATLGEVPVGVAFTDPERPVAGATYIVSVFPSTVKLAKAWSVVYAAGHVTATTRRMSVLEQYLGVADTLTLTGAGSACSLVDARGATLAHFLGSQPVAVGPLPPGTYALRHESTGAEMRVVVRDETPRSTRDFSGTEYALIELGAAPSRSIADVVTTTGGYVAAMPVPAYPSGGLKGNWDGGLRLALGNTAAIDAPVFAAAATLPFTTYILVGGVRQRLECISTSHTASITGGPGGTAAATGTAIDLPASAAGYSLSMPVTVRDSGVDTLSPAAAAVVVTATPANCTLCVASAAVIAGLSTLPDYAAVAARCVTAYASASHTGTASRLALVYDARVRVPSFVLSASPAVSRPAAYTASAATTASVTLTVRDSAGVAVASPTIASLAVDGSVVARNSGGTYTLSVYLASVVCATLSDGTLVYLGETIPKVEFYNSLSALTNTARALPTSAVQLSDGATIVLLDSVTFAADGQYTAVVSASVTPAVPLGSRCGTSSAVTFALPGPGAKHESAAIASVDDLVATVAYTAASGQKTSPPRQGATVTISFKTSGGSLATCTGVDPSGAGQAAQAALGVSAGNIVYTATATAAPLTLALTNIMVTIGASRFRQSSLNVPIACVAIGALGYDSSSALLAVPMLCAGATHTGLSFYVAAGASVLVGATVSVSSSGVIGSTTVASVSGTRAYLGPLVLAGTAGNAAVVTVTLATGTFGSAALASFELTQAALVAANTPAATLSPMLSRTACTLTLSGTYARATLTPPSTVSATTSTPGVWSVRHDPATLDTETVAAGVSGVTSAGVTTATGATVSLAFGLPIEFTPERSCALAYDTTPTVAMSCLATLSTVTAVTLFLRSATGRTSSVLGSTAWSKTANALLAATTTAEPCYVESVLVTATDTSSNQLTATTHMAMPAVVASNPPVASRAFAIVAAPYTRGTLLSSGTVRAFVAASEARLYVSIDAEWYFAAHTPSSTLHVAGLVRLDAAHALVNGVYTVLAACATPTEPSAPGSCISLAGAHSATCTWDDILELARAAARIAGAFTLAPKAAAFPAAPLSAKQTVDNDASISSGGKFVLECTPPDAPTLATCHVVPYPGSRTRAAMTVAAVSGQAGKYECTNAGATTTVSALVVVWSGAGSPSAFVPNRSKYPAYDVVYDYSGTDRAAESDVASGLLSVVSGGTALATTERLALDTVTKNAGQGFTVGATTAAQVVVAIADPSRRCFGRTIGFRELGFARRVPTGQAVQVHGVSARAASAYVTSTQSLVRINLPELTPWPAASGITVAATGGATCTVLAYQLDPAAVIASISATAASTVALTVTAVSGTVTLRPFAAVTLTGTTPLSAMDLSTSAGALAETITAARSRAITCGAPSAVATRWFFGAVAAITPSTATEANCGVCIRATIPSVTVRCSPAGLVVVVNGTSYTAPLPPLAFAMAALSVQIDTAQTTVATAVRARLDGVALVFQQTGAFSMFADSIVRTPVATYDTEAGLVTTSSTVSLAVVRANVDFDTTDAWLCLERAARVSPTAAPTESYTTVKYAKSGTVVTETLTAHPASFGLVDVGASFAVEYTRAKPHSLTRIALSLAVAADTTVVVEILNPDGSWTQVATATTAAASGALEAVLDVSAPRPAVTTRATVTSTTRVLRVAPTFAEPRLRVGVALVANGTKARFTLRSSVGVPIGGVLTRAYSGSAVKRLGTGTLSSTASSTVGRVSTALATLAAQTTVLPTNMYVVLTDDSALEAEADPILYGGVHYAAFTTPKTISIVSVLCATTAAAAASIRALAFADWDVSVSSTTVSAKGQTWNVTSRSVHEVAVAWRADRVYVYCDWAAVGSFPAVDEVFPSRVISAVGQLSQTTARFASLRLRVENPTSLTTTLPASAFEPTWTAVLASSADTCDDAGLGSHSWATYATAADAMPVLPPLVPSAVTLVRKHTHARRDTCMVFTLSTTVSLAPFAVTTLPAARSIATNAEGVVTITTEGTNVTNLRVYLNGTDVTPTPIVYPTVYDTSNVTITATAPAAIAPFEALVGESRDLVVTVGGSAGLPVSAVSVGTQTLCAATASLNDGSTSVVTVACTPTAVGASFELVLTGPDEQTVTLSKSVYVLSVPNPTLSITSVRRKTGSAFTFTATYTATGGSVAVRTAYALALSTLRFAGMTTGLDTAPTVTSTVASLATVVVTATFTPTTAETTPSLGVRVSDRSGAVDSAGTTILESTAAIGSTYAAPTELTSVTCLDYPFPSDVVCMAGVTAAMSATVEVPTSTTLTSATAARGYAVTLFTLTTKTLAFTLQAPASVPSASATAVTFAFSGPDGSAFSVTLPVGPTETMTWPTMTGETTTVPASAGIEVGNDTLVINWPLTGDLRTTDGGVGVVTFAKDGLSYTRLSSTSASVVPFSFVSHSCRLTITVSPRASRTVAAQSQTYESTTVPASRIVCSRLPTSLAITKPNFGTVGESETARTGFTVSVITDDSAATYRGIAITPSTWTQSTGVIASGEHTGVSADYAYLFAKVPTTLCLAFRYNTASADVQKALYATMAEENIQENNFFTFFTHETFPGDFNRDVIGAMSNCPRVLKYCAKDLSLYGQGSLGVRRTLLGRNHVNGNYELQAEYPQASAMWLQQNDPAYTTRTNFDARSITTYLGLSERKAGVLKIDLVGVHAYTRPFTIFAVRERGPRNGTDSKPVLIYKNVGVDNVATLVMQSPTSRDASITYTLPDSCRIYYRFTAGEAGDLVVQDTSGSSLASAGHTHGYTREPTRGTPDFFDDSKRGLVIFHFCVARAELVMSSISDGTANSFTTAETTALLSWAQKTSA